MKKQTRATDRNTARVLYIASVPQRGVWAGEDEFHEGAARILHRVRLGPRIVLAVPSHNLI